MKNYTSQVPAERTVAEIEQLLVRAGARNISKEYTAGEVTALSFVIRCPESEMPLGVRLPANPDAVYSVLRKQRKQWRGAYERKTREQSKRTAWRLMYDWCQVQLSLVEMRQAEFLQVFLPYVWTGRRTFYEGLKEQKFAALGYTPKPADEEAGDG